MTEIKHEDVLDVVWTCFEHKNSKECDIALTKLRSEKNEASGSYETLLHAVINYITMLKIQLTYEKPSAFDRKSFSDLVNSSVENLEKVGSKVTGLASVLKDYCLGMLYPWKGDREKSNKHLLRFLERNVKSPSKILSKVKCAIADNYNVLGEYDSAVKLMQDLLNSNLEVAETPEAYLNLIASYNGLKKEKKFLKYARLLAREIENNPREIDDITKWGYFFNRGMFCATHEQFDEAINYFKRGLDLHDAVESSLSNPSILHSWIAICYHSKGEYEPAIDFYEVALEKAIQEEKRLHIQFMLAKCHYSLKRYRKAISYFLPALELSQTLGSEKKDMLAYSLARSYTYVEDWENALRYSMYCLEKEIIFTNRRVSNEEIDFAIGQSLFKLNRYDEALEYLSKSTGRLSIRLTPWETETNYYIGKIMQSKGEFHKALKRYIYAKSYAAKRRQIRKTPNPEETADYLSMLCHDIGRIYSKLGKNRRAVKYLRRSLRVSQKEIERTRKSYELMAEVYSKLGKDKKAQKAREESLKYSKNSVSDVDENPDSQSSRQ